MITHTFKAFILASLGFSLLSPAYACNLFASEKDPKAESIGLHSTLEAIKSKPSTVIAFHSKNCGTCKVQKPRLQSLLLKEQNSKIEDLFLDFDNEAEIRKAFKVTYPSTIIVFKSGIEVGRVTGETNEAELQKLLDKSFL